MKRYTLLLAVFGLVLMQGCMKDTLVKTYAYYEPVYKLRTEVFANIKSNAPREIYNPGKIYLYGNYIFLNEIDKGIHIIDNSNPAAPVRKAFIDIPGNLDIAVKGNTLYADMYTELVMVDITDPQNARFVKNVPNVFPERSYTSYFSPDSGMVIIDWVRKETTRRIDISGGQKEFVLASDMSFNNGISLTLNGGGGASGIAGSMARFALVNDYLYTVNISHLNTFSISDRFNPVRTSSSELNWNIETIYPFKDKLFIGSTNGMYTFSLNNPAAPFKEGSISHIRSCDPVVADDSYAYVTLRNGTFCGGYTNQLDIVNVSNIATPLLVKSYSLFNPHGLAKDQNLLFICDGAEGLKVYDASDPMNLVLKKSVSGMDTYDAIAWNQNLLVVAKDGLYQFNYADPGNLVLRSKISVIK